MTLIQKLAVGYAFLFFAVVAIGYIPAFNDADGNLFGFRSLNDIEFPARFFANLPHIVIGGFAVYVGFWLSKRIYDHFATA